MKKPLSNLTVFMLVFVLQTSTAFMLGYCRPAKAAGWLAALLGACAAGLFYLLILRLIRLHPGKNWFELLGEVYGKGLGRAIGLIFLLFSLHYAAQLTAYLSRFVGATSGSDRMGRLFALFIAAACILIAGAGVKNAARTVKLIVPVILVIIAVSLVFCLFKFEPGNLLPLLEAGPEGLATGAFSMLLVPFCQILFIFPFFKLVRADRPFAKTLFLSLGVSASVISVFYALNVGVLGRQAAGRIKYPSYAALSVLNATPFLQRIEIILSVHYLLGTLLKTAIVLIFACEGLCFLFNLKDKKLLAVPAGLLALAVAAGIFSDTGEMFRFMEYYPFLSAPFLLLLPAATWAVAEIKQRRKKSLMKGAD